MQLVCAILEHHSAYSDITRMLPLPLISLFPINQIVRYGYFDAIE